MPRYLQLLGPSDPLGLPPLVTPRAPELLDGVYAEPSAGNCTRIVVARDGVVLLDGVMPTAEVTQARLNILHTLFTRRRAG